MTDAIDLRSDTVTRPTEAMAEAMARATQGDDARDGDPTVRELEALAAHRTGKAAALFLPSGTMGNLIAVLAHAPRGSEILMEAGSHTLVSEVGGLSALAATLPRPLPGHRGAMDYDRLREAIRRPGIGRDRAGTGLVHLETSHNQAGGAVLPLAHLAAVGDLARRHGVPVHIDGARLFNAAVTLGVEASVMAQYADSVCFCVSKGLSAPVGSLLCGREDFIEIARGYRRMLGGGMRQAGALAAAGIVALERMVDRLAEDHATARLLAAGLHAIDPALVDPAAVETNIVRVDVSRSPLAAADWSRALEAKNIRVGAYGEARQLRLVTHRHVDAQAVERVLGAVRDLLARR